MPARTDDLIFVEPPDPTCETVVGYYENAAETVEAYFGANPDRKTLFSYRKRGFPVKPGGPYVRAPVFYVLNKPLTTVEAMRRWAEEVEALKAIYR